MDAASEVQYKKGDQILFTATADVLAGVPQALPGGLAGFPLRNIASGDTESLITTGFALCRKAETFVGTAGQGVGYDASATGVDGETGAFTTTRSDWDLYVGRLVYSVAATAESMVVDINEPDIVMGSLDGWTDEVSAADKTLDAQDHLKVITLTVTDKTVTLPSTVAGLEVIVRIGAVIGATIAIAAADKIMGTDLAGTDTKGRVLLIAAAVVGDFVRLKGDGSNGWWIMDEQGAWAEQA